MHHLHLQVGTSFKLESFNTFFVNTAGKNDLWTFGLIIFNPHVLNMQESENMNKNIYFLQLQTCLANFCGKTVCGFIRMSSSLIILLSHIVYYVIR